MGGTGVCQDENHIDWKERGIHKHGVRGGKGSRKPTFMHLLCTEGLKLQTISPFQACLAAHFLLLDMHTHLRKHCLGARYFDGDLGRQTSMQSQW